MYTIYTYIGINSAQYLQFLFSQLATQSSEFFLFRSSDMVNSIIERASETQVEPVEWEKPMLESLDDDPVYSHQEQRKIIQRIDFRLIVMLGFLHCVCLIDRGNLGTAAIAGMEKELRLIGTQYVSFSSYYKTFLSVSSSDSLNRVPLRLHFSHRI